ncbi:hypothetical protein Tco_1455476, partial [Tanacetum coccineum]
VVNTAGSYPFCWTIGFCWSYYDSADTMDYVAGSVYMLVGLPLLGVSFLLIGFVYAANTSIHAAELLDIAGWLVSATSHLVSAGSLHSCWWHNVSAA